MILYWDCFRFDIIYIKIKFQILLFKIYIQIQILYFMINGAFKNLFLFNYIKTKIDIHKKKVIIKILAGKKTYSKLPSLIHVIFIFLTITSFKCDCL